MQPKAEKQRCDVLVVGAGIIGSSVAMHLARKGVKDVLVVDVDLEGSFSSSELNAGGVRATWFHPLNAALSRASIDYFETVADAIGFRQLGYFWMHSKEVWPLAEKSLKANAEARGLGIEYLTPSEVRSQRPFLDKTEDLGGATFSPKDGLLNPNLLKLHYRDEAKKCGVRFLDRVYLKNLRETGNGVVAQALALPTASVEERRELLGSDNGILEAPALEIEAANVVVCSGAWAKRLADRSDFFCASFAQRRQISIFECRDVDISEYGMFVDASGVYFHPEAKNILGGYAAPEEPKSHSFEYDGESFFETFIWPALYARSSKFESLKHVTGWAGLYEVSPDHSAILGRAVGKKKIFEAHSFSGRGVLQSYGAGLYIAELIANGKSETLDLGAFSAERFKRGETVSESLVI